MHLSDNDDPLVQKCVSPSQRQGKAFDTLRTSLVPACLN